MNYKIYYGFLDKDGFIENDENGEFIFCAIVKAQSTKEAIEKLKANEKFASEPQILDIMEVTENGSIRVVQENRN